MADVLSFFAPKSNLFFDLFNESTSNALNMSKMLYKALSLTSEHEELVQLNSIDALKKRAGELKQQVYIAASKTLISPFERNDMFALATAITGFSNSIGTAARRINLYKPKFMEHSVKELAGLIVETGADLDASVNALNDLKNTGRIQACCDNIKAIEHYANRVYNEALSGIIAETDPIEFIKYTDILGSLEKTTGKCTASTAIIESILIKNN